MPERILPEKPLDFLARHGEGLEVLSTFLDPHAVKVVEVTGTDFIRGAGSGANPAGKWWITIDELNGCLAKVRTLPEWPNERRNLLQREIRNRTAVCVNWNSLSAFWGMCVEARPLLGLRGQTREQPVWDPFRGPAPATMGNATQRILPGGVVQYFFPIIPGGAVRYYGVPQGRSF